MQKTLLAVGLTMLLASLAYLNNTENQEGFLNKFSQYKLKYGKTYSGSENAFRQQVYAKNMAIIEAHNADSTQTYQMGENQFTDLTQEEFVATYLTLRRPEGFVAEEISDADEARVIDPNASLVVDWRNKINVKNQGQCGSCWAFSAVGSVEAFFAVTKSQNYNLSEQQLVDCDTSSYGCDGGFEDKAISWAAKHGLKSQSEYPYAGKNQTCKSTSGSVKPNGMSKISKSASALQAAIKSYPVSVAVDATNWSGYKSGVFSNCKSSLNHAVIAAGYYDDGTWLIKNSWATSWGENGYIRLASGNTCGVYSDGSKAI